MLTGPLDAGVRGPGLRPLYDDATMTTRRKPTSTSAFGVGKRESHDSSGFYARFTVPEISTDAEMSVIPDDELDRSITATPGR